MNNVVFLKSYGKYEKILLNLSQQQKKENIWCQYQIIIMQFFYRDFSSSRNEETQIIINKPVYLGISIS